MENLLNKTWTFSEDDLENRLDKFLSGQPELPSRTKLQEWIKDQCFQVDNKACKKNVLVKKY